MYTHPSADIASKLYFACIHIVVTVPLNIFLISIIIVSVSSVHNVMLMRILNVVRSAVDVATSLEYYNILPPTVIITRFFSFLCGL
jgi:hypothetical protein